MWTRIACTLRNRTRRLSSEMDGLTARRYIIKTKEFLFSRKNRDFLVFLFFFFVSTIFWLLQTLNETYEAEIEIPLGLTNVPSDVVITTDLPDGLTVTVKDKGSVLMNYLYGPSFSPVQVDFDSYDDNRISGRVQLLPADIQKAVYTRLLSSSRIVAIRPDTLEFFFNRGAYKKVPVRLAGAVETNPSYYLADVRFVPDSVVVYAPPAILDTVSAAYTQPVAYNTLSSDYSDTLQLGRVRGAKFVPSGVRVRLNVDIYTEKTVEVPVERINFPPSKDLRTFPSCVKITFRVGAALFKSITAEDFVLAVTYEDILNNTSSKLPLRLKSVPEGVSNVRIEPAEVDYLIEEVDEE